MGYTCGFARRRASQWIVKAVLCIVAVGVMGIGGVFLWRPILIGAGLVLMWWIAMVGLAVYRIRRWKAAGWLESYLLEPKEVPDCAEPLDVCVLFCDHFELEHGGAAVRDQIARARRWQELYSSACVGHEDSDGYRPKHTWFVPLLLTAAELRPIMSEWAGRGFGEIEYHSHHPVSAGSEQFRSEVSYAKRILAGMGALPDERYGFVHGMFALAASNPKYCTIRDELSILEDTGCYADFTFPSLGTLSQPRMSNRIFYPEVNGGPKPYDSGKPVCVGEKGNGLMLIQGPLWCGVGWRSLDDANVSANELPYSSRVSNWMEANVHVEGQPNWVFIALHGHTAIEKNQDALWGNGGMPGLWGELEREAEMKGNRLHYITARESYNIIKAAEDGCTGNAGDYRNYLIRPPENIL